MPINVSTESSIVARLRKTRVGVTCPLDVIATGPNIIPRRNLSLTQQLLRPRHELWLPRSTPDTSH